MAVKQLGDRLLQHLNFFLAGLVPELIEVFHFLEVEDQRLLVLLQRFHGLLTRLDLLPVVFADTDKLIL